jgi:hypothetical protein
MKPLNVFFVTLLIFTMAPSAQASFFHRQASHRVGIVVPLVAAAAVITTAVILAHNPPPQNVVVIQQQNPPVVYYAPNQNPGYNPYDTPVPYVPASNPYNY